MIGLHRSYVEDLIAELERGAKLGPWIEEFERECAAAPELIGIILREQKAVRS
jgi:hypothetical protein